MRALLLAVVVLGSACTDDTLSEDTAYRRLVDTYDSEAQCLAQANITPCYQTLTLCSSGKVRMDLVNRPQDGEYTLSTSSLVFARFIDMQVEFDLEARKSAYFPGRHPWLKVETLSYDCQP